MGKLREEDEVAHKGMPMTWQKVIGEKASARGINPKILGFIFSAGFNI